MQSSADHINRVFFVITTNSLFVLVRANISRIFSSDSSAFMEFVALRTISTASASSLVSRRSSRLVPDFKISMAGKILFSESFLSRTSSLLPVPLNSSKIRLHSNRSLADSPAFAVNNPTSNMNILKLFISMYAISGISGFATL